MYFFKKKNADANTLFENNYCSCVYSEFSSDDKVFILENKEFGI